MNKKPWHFWLLYIALFLNLLLITDIFFIGHRIEKEVIVNIDNEVKYVRRGKMLYYFINTEQGSKYYIGQWDYYEVIKGDTVLVLHSSFSNVKQKLELQPKNGRPPHATTFFATSDSAAVVSIFLLTVLMLMILFYRRITYLPGRNNLTFVLSLSSVLIWWYYL